MLIMSKEERTRDQYNWQKIYLNRYVIRNKKSDIKTSLEVNAGFSSNNE